MSTAFELTVELPNGQKAHYLAANDLEPAIMHRVKTRGNSWQEVWINALFNVPVAPYLPKGAPRRRPPIRTVKVLNVKEIELTPETEKLMRTRSQFLPVAIWKQQSVDQSFNFLRHDHPFWSQKQIRADIDFWKDDHHHPVINFVTWLRTKLQWHRLHVANRRVRTNQ